MSKARRIADSIDELTTDEIRHSIRPSLLLDFANSKTLDPRIDFTRSSTATYYDGKTHAKAEENLCINSEAFGQFGKINVTVTADSTAAPDGNTTAETVTETSVSGSHNLIQNNNPIIVGQTYTVSVYAKIASGTRNLGFRGFGNGGTGEFPVFNISSGTIARAGTEWSDTTITDVGNGWYRCSSVTTATTATQMYLHLTDGTTENYTGDGSSGLYLWGAQLEQRSSVTAYTPTTSQPITNYIPVLQTAASGTARFDHNASTGESLGLLIEEQRTNLLPYSEDFSQGAWSKTNCSVTANTVVAPDGTLTGDLVYQNTATGQHNVQEVYTVTSGTTYTWSAYLKAQNNRYIIFQNGAAGGGDNIVIDTNDWSVNSSSTSPIYSITHVGNNWYRVTLTGTAVSSADTGYRVGLVDSDGTTMNFTGDGYSGVYIWGAQLEAASFPTSYIPTSGSQVTRSADSASMTGDNFSSWYRQDEGTVYADFFSDKWIAYNRAIFSFDQNGNANPSFYSYYTNGINFVAKDPANSNIASDFGNTPITDGRSNKISFAYKTDDFAGGVNGSLAFTDASGFKRMDANTLSIGSVDSYGLNQINGHIKKLAYYPTRLTNAELTALTED